MSADAEVVVGLEHAAQNRTDLALASFDRAIALDPRHLVARQARAAALMGLGSYDAAYAASRDVLTARHSSRWWPKRTARDAPPEGDAFALSSAVKLRHDREQIHHLALAGLLPKGAERLERAYGDVLAEIEGAGNRVLRLTEVQRKHIGAGYNRVIHLDAGRRVPAAAVADGWNRDEATASFASRRIAIVDGFLAPDALGLLRRFCMESTIWFDTAHAQGGRGYIGADGMDGLACPLLFQIAEDLRRALPAVIGTLPLIKLWAFKYDHALQGINAHADAARVNVNFWITPDEACLDSSAGGMVVYDAHVPADWSFNAYNADPGGLLRHIQSVGGKAVNVPYRQNRAVVFDSDLVHATQPLRFRPGYANRRINVTLLYGHRQ
ncbi:MAG: hypothetical protein EXQ95_03525 [Alphaproteobacteria bacterium]|nr:hypothetical protein [Alphaproteobacteria bacterium]